MSTGHFRPVETTPSETRHGNRDQRNRWASTWSKAIQRNRSGLISWLTAARIMGNISRKPARAEAAHGHTACMVSLNDIADRPPRQLADGEVLDLGGKRVRYLDTPHIPHGWEAGVLYEENTKTLLCGDLFTQTGNGWALTESDIVGPAIAAEDLFKYSSLNPGMGTTIRKLAEFSPLTLALMHGPAFKGDSTAALRSLADDYDRRVIASADAAGFDVVARRAA
jgi:hypothetical protein